MDGQNMRLVFRPTSAPTSARRVSFPDSVVDAPPLIGMLPAEARLFLEEFQARMLLPAAARGCRCSSRSFRGELGCRNDPRLLRSARSYARLVRRTMKIVAHCPHRSTRLCVRRLLREGESPSAHR